MHVKKDDVPILTAPLDNLWLEFRDNETLGVLWLESLGDAATVEVASGPSNDPSLLGAPSTLTFAQAGIRQRVTLPIGGSPVNRYTRIRPTVGRVSASIAAPSDFRFYIQNT